MKLAASLKIRSTVFLVLALTLSQINPASASIYTISQLSGGAQYAPSLYGQTFLVPSGYSGSISGVSNLTYTGFNATIASVIWAKVWNSPSKTTLLATSSNTFTGSTSASGWLTPATFSLNFPTFNVYGGNSYYLEVGRSSGTGNFYISELGTNPYANGSVYHDGAINTSYDLKFSFDITYPIEPTFAPAPSISVSTSQKKGVTATVTATTTLAGHIAFKINGKNIPGCQKVLATGSPFTASCTWKPSVRGNIQLTAQLLPSDTATYSNSSLASVLVPIASRTNTR